MPGSSGLYALDWDGPAVALLDLDAFFASVEQLDHPEWRGSPVIVGGSPDRRGVVSTASYEARRFGVHSAMASATAARLCPDAIWVPGRFDRYHELSRAVMAILGDETPLVEQVSVDEAFFDVTPGRFSRESPVDICRRVQGRVASLGITCSIGLGVNKTVAKIASEREKPRGLTVVFPGTEARFLAPLPVSAMSGVGAATAARLEGMGIRTLGELSRMDPSALEAAFGVQGSRMALRAAGRERSRVREAIARQDAKSVSNERTFESDIVDRAELDQAIRHVATICGRRLRGSGLRGSTLTLKLRFGDLSVRTARRHLPEPCDDDRVFGPLACRLADGLWAEGRGVRLVGVGMSDFRDTGLQLRLGEATVDEPSHASVSTVADRVRERFGAAAMSYGRDLRVSSRTSDTPSADGDGAEDGREDCPSSPPRASGTRGASPQSRSSR